MTGTGLGNQMGETGNWAIGQPANLAAIQAYDNINRALSVEPKASGRCLGGTGLY